MKKKLFCYLLICAMTLAQTSVIAETEDSAETFEYTLSPENYAIMHITKTGYSGHVSNARNLELYYNQLYNDTYTEFGSVISEYDVPLKNALTTMAITYRVNDAGGLNNGSVPVFYDLNSFSINATSGVYASTTEEYKSVRDYVSKYWPATDTSYGYSTTTLGKQVACKAMQSNVTSGSMNTWDVTTTALAALKVSDAEKITFATGRDTSQYINFSLGVDPASEIPTLTLKYDLGSILNAVNTAGQADLNDIIEDLGTIGLLADTTNGYSGYSALIGAARNYVDSSIYSDITSGGYDSLTDFHTAYDEYVDYAEANGTLIAINSVKSAAEMKAMVEELGEAGSLASYDKYTALASIMKNQVASVLYETVTNGGYASTDAFFAKYDEAVAAADEESSEDAVTAKLQPENYAIMYITQDVLYHSSAVKDLKLYYNTFYSDEINSEFASIITSYKVLLKEYLSDMSIGYYVNSVSGLNNGSVPVFYDLNKFELGIENGTYASASDEYAKAKTYTANYWPSSGTSYSSTGFAKQIAQKITSATTRQINSYNVTDAMNAYIGNADAEYITFATGRETSGYINYAMYANKSERIPALTLTYETAKLVDFINSAETAADFDNIIKTLGNAGILSNSIYGYEGYTGLGEKYRADICEAVYNESGYVKFGDFIDAYDAAVLRESNNAVNMPVVSIDFNDSTANDTSGNGKNATIVGAAGFTTGPDGSKALKVTNSFGKTAQQYLDMGAYDFSEESFSIVFWMKAPERGVDYEVSGDIITSGTAVDFSTYNGTKGGVALSNKDFSVNGNTGFAFAAMPIYTDFSYNMKMSDGSAVNTTGVQTASDSRWHQLAYVVNRAGNATFYVDGTVVKATDISSLTGSLGTGNLIFGADGLGQYGMMHGEFDDIKIYSSALEATKVQELYYITALKKVNNEINSFLNSDKSTAWSDANIVDLTAEYKESAAFIETYELGNADAIKAKYEEINNYYDEFLNRDTIGTIAFGSDVHISEASESHQSALNLKQFLTESESWENAPKTFIISGDITDVGADDMGYFFSHLNNWMVDGSNMVICRGNHDEPVGTDPDGNKLTRAELKDLYMSYMDGYVDKTNKFNSSFADESLPFYYSTDGAAHYIAVDNYWPDIRKISDAQFEWLKSILDEVSGDGKPIFVVQHLPLLGQISNSAYLGLDEDDDAQLKALLAKYDNTFILSGHTHHGFGGGTGNPQEGDGYVLINAPAMRDKSGVRGYEYPSGYYINVHDGYVTFRARDFQNQKWLRDYDLTYELTAARVLPSDVEAECTENFNDTTLSDGEQGASIWQGTILGTGTAYEQITATATDKDGKTAVGTYSETTISGDVSVEVIVVINRMKELLESVVLSVK